MFPLKTPFARVASLVVALVATLLTPSCVGDSPSADGSGGSGGAAAGLCDAAGLPTKPPASYSPCQAPSPSQACPDMFGGNYNARVTCAAGATPPAAGCCKQKDVDDWCCPAATLCTSDGKPTSTVTSFDPCPTPSPNAMCVTATGSKPGKSTTCPSGKSPPAAACCVLSATSTDTYCCP